MAVYRSRRRWILTVLRWVMLAVGLTALIVTAAVAGAAAVVYLLSLAAL